MNLCILSFSFLILAICPSNSSAHQKYSRWVGDCLKCFKKVKWMEGVFCAIVYWTLGTFPPCHSAWCGSYYTSEGQHLFYVSSLQTQNQERTEEEEERRMSISGKWKQKEVNPLDLHQARNGDHAICPFECDLCIFRKLRGKSSRCELPNDKLYMVMIRRMNLDAFWARARSTVDQNTRRINHTLKFSESLGLLGPFDHSSPHPLTDHCGYEVAAAILMHPRRPGRHDRSYTQFETMKKLRSSYSPHVRSVREGNVN